MLNVSVSVVVSSLAELDLTSYARNLSKLFHVPEDELLVSIDAVRDAYDLVLIDCPPSLNGLTRMAWTASDRVLVVTEPSLFSVAATQRAFRAVDELQRAVSPRLRALGVVINRVRPQSIEHQFRIDEMREMFDQRIIEPPLYERVVLQQAQGSATPVHLWPGESAEEAAAHFDALLQRIEADVPVGQPG